MDDEGERLRSLASLTAQLRETLESPQLEHLVDERFRRDLRLLNARALALLADLQHPRLLQLVRPPD